MCQSSQCAFEGYEGECNLTSKETKAIIDKFDREPCPNFTSELEEEEYWAWIELVEDFLDEIRAQEEKVINELFDKALKGE